MTTFVKLQIINITVWFNPDQIESIHEKADGTFNVSCSSEDSYIINQSQLDLLLSACTVISSDNPPPVGTPYMASASDDPPTSPTGESASPPLQHGEGAGGEVSARLVRMERAQTSNSKSPMWRCRTDDGIKVNVFQHNDPEKNSFRMFEGTDYEPLMSDMKVGDILAWKNHPIEVTLRKNGDWWNLVSVESRPTVPLSDTAIDTPGTPEYIADQKCSAVSNAKIWSAGAVVIDLETTSLDTEEARIIQVAVIDHEGTVLLDTLVNPGVPIPDEIAALIGITDDRVKNAPPFAEVAGKLFALLRGKTVVAYNAKFDRAVFEAEWNRCVSSPAGELPSLGWQCAMKTYSRYYGVWNAYRDDFNWFKLATACANESITIDAPLHSALGDAQRALALIHKMAAHNGDIQGQATPEATTQSADITV